MNAGLLYLFHKGPGALARRARRRFRGVKGLLLLLGIGVLLTLIIGPQILSSMIQRDGDATGGAFEGIRTWAPAAILLMVLLSMRKGALYFRPAEVQFLFPAPITRRQLLLYNVVSKLRVQVLSGLWCSIFVLRYAPSWYAGLLAPIAALVFLQLTTQASGLLFAALGERFARLAKRLGLFAFVGLLLVALATTKLRLPADAGLMDCAKALLELPVVAALCWTTRPFVELYLAESLVQFAYWAVIIAVILLAEIGLMMLFDVAYTEAAVGHARKTQQALARMSSGGGAFALAGAKRSGLSIPKFPFWHGAGPIAWRQCQEMTRNFRGALMIGMFIFIWIGGFAIVPAMTGAGKEDPPPIRVMMPLLMILIMTPMMTMNFAFDFRRDLDRMTILKSLPLSPRAIAAGQLLPMALLVSFWQALGVIAMAIISGQIPPALLIGILLVLLPLNWVVGAVDNVIFLLLPYRIVARDTGKLPFMGRITMVMFLKMIALAVVGGLCALLGYLIWEFTDGAPIPTAVAVAAFLAIACIPLTLAVAAAFRSFDVSSDLPP
jgi:hypothetical protein